MPKKTDTKQPLREALGITNDVIDRFLPDVQNLIDLASSGKKEREYVTEIKIDVIEPRITDLVDRMLLSVDPLIQSITGDISFQQQIWKGARSHVRFDFEDTYFPFVEFCGPNVSDLAATFASSLRQHLRRLLREHFTMICRLAVQSAKADMLPKTQRLVAKANRAFLEEFNDPPLTREVITGTGRRKKRRSTGKRKSPRPQKRI